MTTVHERARTVPVGLVLDDHPPSVRSGDDAGPVELERFRERRRRWRSRLVFAIVVTFLVALGVERIATNMRNRDRLPVPTAVLTADMIDVVATSPGSVVDVLVGPQQPVEAGETVAVLEVVRLTAGGGEQRVRTELTAPVAGVVATVPAKVGAAVVSTQIVVRMYRPDELYLRADLPLDTLSDARFGMRGTVEAKGVGTVEVSLAGIEPDLDAPAGRPRVVHLTLRPIDPARLAGLVPGIEFTGWLLRSSAASDAPSGVRAGTAATAGGRP